MSDWYKMFPIDWNDGTTNLTLEQEAAYLRICNAIYMTGGPIPNNKFVLAGLFRCDARRALRLLNDLIEAEKVIVEGASIRNRRADDELSNRQRIANDRQTAGKRGGIASGIARSKSLKNGDAREARPSSQSNERRVEEIREDIKERNANAFPKKVGSRLSPDWVLPDDFRDWCKGEWPSIRIEFILSQADKFRDYWIGKSGKDATKVDWGATWRNWMRRAVESAGRRPQAQHSSAPKGADWFFLAAEAIENGQERDGRSDQDGRGNAQGLPLTIEHHPRDRRGIRDGD